MNVESFNLDHTRVAAPFVRVADRKRLPGGDELVKYDVRFCQPNREHLDMRAVHSIEHLTAELMGAGEGPPANEVQCGWGANHSLEAAQAAVRGFLAARDEWEVVIPDAGPGAPENPAGTGPEDPAGTAGTEQGDRP